MVDVDSETLFNGAAALVATIAVVVFVLNVEFGYSPVSKFALVVLFLTAVFALSQRTDDSQLTLFAYGVVVVSVVALFVDLVNTFDVADTVLVLGLLVIAGGLFGVRRVLDENNRFVAGELATYALAAVAVITVVVLLVDVVSGGLAYELQPRSEVTVPDSRRDELRVGSVEVTNPTPLPERVDVPNYGVCTAGNWSAYRRSPEGDEPPPPVHADLHVESGYNDHVLSFGSRSYPVDVYLDGTGIAGETFPVERTSTCPETETGPPYLAVFERADRRRGIRPA